MTVIGYDPHVNASLAQAASVTVIPKLEDLLASSDFVTIHTPLIASTKGMIGSKQLAMMKPTARILNVARGGTIDEAALLEALDQGQIAGAGLDILHIGATGARLNRCPLSSSPESFGNASFGCVYR